MEKDLALSESIMAEALSLGFDACGICKAETLSAEAEAMEKWLQKGFQGEMSYLERNREKRYDPRLLQEGTLSVVSVLYNYFPEAEWPKDCHFKIAKYAYGEDYHTVVKEKLAQLLHFVEENLGPMPTARCFVDSAPVMDRVWAAKAGLGFIGKNTCLIHPRKGSFFFIGHLFLPVDLVPTGKPLPNRCGNCTKCLDACPTGALQTPFSIDARKCISYLTIEYRGSLAGHDPSQFHDSICGCDICQDVCPYNRFSLPAKEPRFQASEDLLRLKKQDWLALDAAQFKAIFKKSALQRLKFEGLKRNIDFLQEGKSE